jgi:hypothetical protein
VPDPTPFLSTIAAVSATLVAIIGGLLVARFVSLDSEQQGAQQLLDNASGRLLTAQNRAGDARKRLRSWQINDFFDTEVLESIAAGEHNIEELRQLGGYTTLSDDDLSTTVQLVADEYSKARQTLQTLRVGDEVAPSGNWEEFRRQSSEPLDIRWEEVWEIAYDDLVTPQRPGHFSYPVTLPGAEQAQYTVLRLQRRDALVATVERTDQHVEDLQAEVDQLEATRDAVIKPKGLAGGLAVLSWFTIVGVIVPLWLMSRAPTALTAGLGEVVFWLFLTGLLLLLLYMSVLAMRLSNRGRKFLVAVDAWLPKWVRKILRRPYAESPVADGSDSAPAEGAADSVPKGTGTESEQPKEAPIERRNEAS